MRLLQPAAALMAAALSLASTGMPALALSRGGTMFDLGIDTSQVSLDRQDVGAYLASLEPETSQIIMSSCAHYLTTPLSARSQDTLDFCRVALGAVASGTVKTFASSEPLVLRPTQPPPQTRSSFNSDCQFPHYTIDPDDPCY